MTDVLIGEYIGISWAKDGHSFTGCSCWGLVRLFYRNKYDIELPDFPSSDFVASAWSSVKKPALGDVLLFRTATGPHVGIALTNTEMLHVDECTTSRIENFKGLAWKNRLRKIYRYRQLASPQ